MSDLDRIGVAIATDLLGKFDVLIEKRGYSNRSEAFRDLIRAELVREASSRPTGRVVGSLTVIYDHHVRELTERLTEIQHDSGSLILSTLHVHLDHHHCLEVIAAKGPARVLKTLAERLLGTKGVVSGDVVAAALPLVHR